MISSDDRKVIDIQRPSAETVNPFSDLESAPAMRLLLWHA